MKPLTLNFTPPKRLLTPTDRVAHYPLNSWARDLLLQLEEETLTLELWKAKVGCLALVFNQSSLINFHLGRLDIAEELCNRQLGWLLEAFSVTRDIQFISFAFHPWVNYCRLNRATGRFACLADRLRNVLNTRNGLFNPLVNCAISKNEWDTLSEVNPTYEIDVARICFRELLLTQLDAQDYFEALTILMDPTLGRYALKITLLDAMALILCLLQAPKYSLELLSDQKYSGAVENLLVSVRTLEALLTAGLFTEAELLISKIIGFLRNGLDEHLLPSEVDLYCHLALLLEYVGYLAESNLLASTCYTSYRRLDDEVGAYNAARISFRCASKSEARMWSNVIHELARSSCYVRIRREFQRNAPNESDICNVERLNSILLSPAPHPFHGENFIA